MSIQKMNKNRNCLANQSLRGGGTICYSNPDPQWLNGVVDVGVVVDVADVDVGVVVCRSKLVTNVFFLNCLLVKSRKKSTNRSIPFAFFSFPFCGSKKRNWFCEIQKSKYF